MEFGFALSGCATSLAIEVRFTTHGSGENGEYADGWFTGTRPWAKDARPGDAGWVFHHDGDNTRGDCVVWVAPEIDFAILIARNRSGMRRALDENAGQLVAKYAQPKPAA
jgi:hypothetical protein